MSIWIACNNNWNPKIKDKVIIIIVPVGVKVLLELWIIHVWIPNIIPNRNNGIPNSKYTEPILKSYKK